MLFELSNETRAGEYCSDLKYVNSLDKNTQSENVSYIMLLLLLINASLFKNIVLF